MLDSNTEERDKKVAQHVLRLHRYRGRGDEPGLSSRGEEAEMDPSTFDKENEEQETPQFQVFLVAPHFIVFVGFFLRSPLSFCSCLRLLSLIFFLLSGWSTIAV